MDKHHFRSITTLSVIIVMMCFSIVFAEGSSTQSTYTSGSGTVVLQGIFTDSTLTAEDAIDYSENLTTSGTLKKTYCFSITINNIAEGCSVKSIKADFAGTGLPNANAGNISLSRSGDNVWSCILEGNTSGGYVDSFTITLTHACSFTSEKTIPSTCVEHGSVSDMCSCGHSVIKETLDLAEHQFGDWETITEPTSQNTGMKQRVCSVCNFTDTEITFFEDSECEHNLVKIEAKEATDTANGNVEYWTCSKCGKCFYDQDGWEEMSQFSWIIPAQNAFGKYGADEIASVELIPIKNSPYELLEEDDGYYTTDENGNTFFSYEFSWRLFETGDILRISLNNGSYVDYINADGNYSCFVNIDDSSDVICFFSSNTYNENGLFKSINDKTARVPGETFDYYFSYKGNNFSTQVYIKENPVESVEFETYDNEPIQIRENDPDVGDWETDENGCEYFFYSNWPHNDGDKLTINYKDGTIIVFSYSSVENTFISETTGEAITEYPFETGRRGLDYQSGQYGYHWLAGNEYTASIGYYRKWADLTVKIVPVYETGEYRIFPTQIVQDLEVGESAEIIPEIRTASADPSKEYEVIDDGITYTWTYDQNDVEIVEDTTGSTPKYTISRKTFNRTTLTLTASWGGINTATWTYDLDGFYCDHDLVKTDAVPATCTKEGNITYWRCKHCGTCFRDENANTVIDESDTVIPKTGHTFTEWETKIAATESADGQQTRTCSICGVKETKIIPKLSPSTPSVSPSDLAVIAPSEITDLPTVKISKPKAAKKKITVKWKKVSKKNLKKIGGIQIQVATDPGFTNIVKTTTAGKKKTSKKIGGLQSKTKYYVRIRAYAAGNHVSAWKSKSAKVK